MGAITSYTLTAPLLATDTIVFDRSGDTKSGVLGAMAPFSALTLVADRLPYANGSGTMALATFTAAGRALIDDADAAAQCTTLGLGTGDSPQFTAVNIGHASDTTISRASAGDINVEGNIVYRAGGTDVPVTDGGTGRSTSTTAYGLIAAGTTATGAHQTLAAGATTEILVGGGAAALPVWTAATGTGAPVRAAAPTISGVAVFSGVPSLTGGGLAFPATQVASANANTLDDYEEGTFTPTLTFGGGSTGITYSTREGRYTKIGNRVFGSISIVLTSKGSSTGGSVVSGLPFTNTGAYIAGSLISQGMSSLGVSAALLIPGDTILGVYDNNGGNLTAATHTYFTNASELYIEFNYNV